MIKKKIEVIFVLWLTNKNGIDPYARKLGSPILGSALQNEGPVRIQYKCLVFIYVFPEMKRLFLKQDYNVLSPSSYTHISVRDLYIS